MRLRHEFGLLLFSIIVLTQLYLDTINKNWSTQDWSNRYKTIFEQFRELVKPGETIGFVTGPEMKESHKACLIVGQYTLAPSIIRDSEDENTILGCFSSEESLLNFARNGNYEVAKVINKFFALLRKKK